MESINKVSLGESDASLDELNSMLNELNEVVCRYVGHSTGTKISVSDNNKGKVLAIQIDAVSELMFRLEKHDF